MLSSQHEMTDLGKTDSYLGIHITCEINQMLRDTVDQSRYILEIVDCFSTPQTAISGRLKWLCWPLAPLIFFFLVWQYETVLCDLGLHDAVHTCEQTPQDVSSLTHTHPSKPSKNDVHILTTHLKHF
jgi:hypothetical protein